MNSNLRKTVGVNLLVGNQRGITINKIWLNITASMPIIYIVIRFRGYKEIDSMKDKL